MYHEKYFFELFIYINIVGKVTIIRRASRVRLLGLATATRKTEIICAVNWRLNGITVNEMWQRRFVLPNTCDFQSTIIQLFYIYLSVCVFAFPSLRPLSLSLAFSLMIFNIFFFNFILFFFPFHRLGIDIIIWHMSIQIFD